MDGTALLTVTTKVWKRSFKPAASSTRVSRVAHKAPVAKDQRKNPEQVRRHQSNRNNQQFNVVL